MSDPIIIDNGTGVLKAGVAGTDAPSVKFPAVIGYPTAEPVPGTKKIDHYIGDEALKFAGVCNLKHPIASGLVTDWDAMEHIWQYCFENELRVNPTEQNVMLTTAPNAPTENKKKMVEVMFERFKVPGVYVAIQGVLALMGSGRVTGLIVDSGDGVTHTVPVYESFQVKAGIMSNDVAGRKISSYLRELLVRDNIGVN